MKTKLFVITTLIMLLSSAYLFGQFFIFDNLYVTRVIDGDTVIASNGVWDYRVRLVGIDAPEMNSNGGRRAKMHLVNIVNGHQIKIKPFGKDKYHRILGEIYIGDLNVNLKMVTDRCATVYHGRHPAGFNPEPYLKANEND